MLRWRARNHPLLPLQPLLVRGVRKVGDPWHSAFELFWGWGEGDCWAQKVKSLSSRAHLQKMAVPTQVVPKMYFWFQAWLSIWILTSFTNTERWQQQLQTVDHEMLCIIKKSNRLFQLAVHCPCYSRGQFGLTLLRKWGQQSSCGANSPFFYFWVQSKSLNPETYSLVTRMIEDLKAGWYPVRIF